MLWILFNSFRFFADMTLHLNSLTYYPKIELTKKKKKTTAIIKSKLLISHHDTHASLYLIYLYIHIFFTKHNLQLKQNEHYDIIKPLKKKTHTWIKRLENAVPSPLFCLFRYDFPSFQADMVCVSSSSSVRLDP